MTDITPYPFTMTYRSAHLDMVARTEPDGSIVSEPDHKMDAPMMSLNVRVRRHDRAGIERQHDVRVVSSEVNHRKGTIETTLELSDVYVPLSTFAKVCGEYAVKNRICLINLMDEHIIAMALTEQGY